MSDQDTSVPEEQSFGEALAELDRIVNQLEDGQLELEESIARYERGVGLLKALQTKLTDAQQKVTVLIGELEEETGGVDSTSSDGPDSASSTTSEEVPF